MLLNCSQENINLRSKMSLYVEEFVSCATQKQSLTGDMTGADGKYSVDEQISAVHFPELWSTHITEADRLQMEKWKLEAEVPISGSLSKRSSVSASHVKSPVDPSRKRKYQIESVQRESPDSKVRKMNQAHRAYHHYPEYPRNDRFHWTPASRGQAPVSRGRTPAHRGQAPFFRGQTPAPRGQTPISRGQTPAHRGQAPVKRGQTPVSRSQTPAPKCQTHARRGQSPSHRGKTPVSRGQTPVHRGQSPVHRGHAPAYRGQTTSAQWPLYQQTGEVLTYPSTIHVNKNHVAYQYVAGRMY